MAPGQDGYAVTVLRSVTYRITATPTKQLPAIVPHVTATLPACKSVLSAAHSSSAKDASEAALLLHKFRTQISTLLQDRSIEGRWSGVILAKSAVELGGWETLQKCGPWVRGLLGILTKPDPPTTKVLCIVTLTRIFMLTRDYQTLVREITTPSLTPFITSCMNTLARFKGADAGLQQLVETILESFAHLLPRHPTIFRPHLTKLGQFLATVLAPGQANLLSAEGLAAARHVYTQIPFCAAKGAFQQEWEKSFQTIIAASHQTADKLFRAVIEDWESVTGVQPSNNNVRAVEQEVQQAEPDLCGFPAWTGIYAGSRRLIGLLELLAELTTASTAGVVGFRIAHVVDLLTRILSVTAPAAAKGRKQQETGITFNDQIGKEERSDLWVVLPHVHVAAIGLFEALVERFGHALVPIMDFFVERLSFLFQEEKSLAVVRAATYSALIQVLPIAGQTLPATQVKGLNGIMHACCDDILPREKDKPSSQLASTPAVNGNKNKQPQISMNADTFLGTTSKDKSVQPTVQEDLYELAYALLPLLFENLPAQAIDYAVRNHMESTAVLVRHKNALLASVTNIPVGGNTQSLLPLLARMFPDSPEVEVLLRPRMPVIKAAGSSSLPTDADEEEEEDEEEDEEEVEKEEDDEDGDQMQVDNEPAAEMEENAPQDNVPKPISKEITTKNALETPQEEPASSSSREGGEKRQSRDSAPQAPSPKRLRVGSPGRIALQEQKVEAAASSVKPAPAPAVSSYGGDDADEDDENVEIPTLVMGEDEEDSDEE